MDKIRLRIDGDEYWVQGGDFDDMLDAIRSLPGRVFDAGERIWEVSGEPRRIAASLDPFQLLYQDDDPLADSKPIRVAPS